MEGSQVVKSLKSDFASLSTTLSGRCLQFRPPVAEVPQQASCGWGLAVKSEIRNRDHAYFPDSSRRFSGEGCSSSRRPDRSDDGLKFGPRLDSRSDLPRAAWLWPFAFWGKRGGGMLSGKKKVMILMSDTGGGHRASAEALKAGFEAMYGQKYHVDYVDIWTHHTPWPFSELPKSYSTLVRNPFVWRMGYYCNQPRIMHNSAQLFASLYVRRSLSEFFAQYDPDLVISVHPLMQLVPLMVLRQQEKLRGGHHTPFATVVTDLTTCHNTWFNPGVDKCFVPTEYTARLARRMGLKEGQIVLHGLPIRPAFSRRLPDKRRLRRHLGMDKTKPAVLIVGGGEGMGAIEATCEALAEDMGASCQVVAICGRNKKLIDRLQARQWPHGMHVTIRGFVTNMEEWMGACDAIVTKAGPGTIAESLISGLPMVLNGFIPCQEAGNVPFVVDNKVGAFEKDPQKIADLLTRWFGDERPAFQEMAGRARQMGVEFKSALFRIVADLADLCNKYSFQHQHALA
eukprot:jgi/Botrbrau1/11284/Bobra.0038s0050.1